MTAPPPASDNPLLRRLRDASTHIWVVALGLVACLPTLWGGLSGDDWLQWARLQRLSVVPDTGAPIWTLFEFIPGGAEHTAAYQERSLLQWWQADAVQIDFLRPLSALTHELDHLLWPDQIWLHHAHSLLWFAAAAALAGALFRRWVPEGWVAGVALWIFVLEDAHSGVIGWLAARNALIVLTIGLAALHAHLKGSDGSRWGYPAALLLYVISLGCGESAVALLPWLFAWQVTRDEPWLRRVLPLLPYAAVTVIWRAIYDAWGYGAFGSILYLDPGREPLTFLFQVVLRAPILFASQLTQIPSDPWVLMPPWAQLASAGVAMLICAVFARHVWLQLADHPQVRFLGLGAALSLLPFTAANPMDRLLLWSGLGFAPLIALLLWRLRGQEAAGEPLTGEVQTRLLVGTHTLVAPALLVVRLIAFPIIYAPIETTADEAPHDAAIASQTLVMVNGHELTSFYVPVVRAVKGQAAPRRTSVLAGTVSPTEVTRLDDHRLRVHVPNGMLQAKTDRIAWSPQGELREQGRREMPDFTVIIEALSPEQTPETVLFEFREPLEGGSYRFMVLDHGKLEPFELPAVGETTTTPWGMGVLEFLLD